QQGSGDPSPTNVRDIVPWTGVKVWNGGKNLFNKETVSTGVWWKGSVLSGYPNHRASALIPVKAGSYYTIDRNSNAQNAVCLFDKDGSYVDQLTFDNYIKARIIPDGICYVGITVFVDALDTAIVYAGQTATAYEPYKPITETDISFPSPVYGGEHEAVSGKLMDGWGIVDLGSLAWTLHNNTANRQAWKALITGIKRHSSWSTTTEAICDSFKSVSYNSTWIPYVMAQTAEGNDMYFCVESNAYASAEEFKQAMTGKKLCYPLATPQEIQLTPEQITALLGDNTIWSDADGSMTAVYLKKG
ncbi:MAG: hypothetical protein J6T99_11045, partial [Oscillospiraceae bacterium]|nr:hypothetical protein [Oscillospiraceae bacterium]